MKWFALVALAGLIIGMPSVQAEPPEVPDDPLDEVVNLVTDIVDRITGGECYDGEITQGELDPDDAGFAYDVDLSRGRVAVGAHLLGSAAVVHLWVTCFMTPP